ncbi:MAG: hypothetical protein IKC47_03710 [Clostridia bacterium]|nr:hypothetical protein [Clostridia bacterium]
MKYHKCKRCQLNYVTVDEEICKVCLEQQSKGFCEQDERELCPFCYKNYVGYDQLMCKKCWEKRNKKQ